MSDQNGFYLVRYACAAETLSLVQVQSPWRNKIREHDFRLVTIDEFASLLKHFGHVIRLEKRSDPVFRSSKCISYRL